MSKNKFVLYCKSFRNDVDRASLLLDSINKFNNDHIDFFISVPKKDVQIFKNKLGIGNYELIEDEEIFNSNKFFQHENLEKIPGNLSQQIIKSEFWRLGICDSYLCIDSDSVFIKNFHQKLFFNKNEIYTVAHDSADFFDEVKKNKKNKIISNFNKESRLLREYFQRNGQDYDFGPSPFLWDKKVWQWLSDYLEERKMNFINAIRMYGTEDRWYGESLLKSKIINFYPIKPLFKVYHYEWQYKSDHQKDKFSNYKKDYLGIVYQSNWNKKMDSAYVPKKNIFSRLNKKIRSFFN